MPWTILPITPDGGDSKVCAFTGSPIDCITLVKERYSMNKAQLCDKAAQFNYNPHMWGGKEPSQFWVKLCWPLGRGGEPALCGGKVGGGVDWGSTACPTPGECPRTKHSYTFKMETVLRPASRSWLHIKVMKVEPGCEVINAASLFHTDLCCRLERLEQLGVKSISTLPGQLGFHDYGKHEM